MARHSRPVFPFLSQRTHPSAQGNGKRGRRAFGKVTLYIYLIYIYTFLGKLEWFVWNFIPIHTIFRVLLPRRKIIHFLRYQEMSIG